MIGVQLAGIPLIEVNPDDPSAQAVRQAARGIVAITPIELPVMQAPSPPQPLGIDDGPDLGKAGIRILIDQDIIIFAPMPDLACGPAHSAFA